MTPEERNARRAEYHRLTALSAEIAQQATAVLHSIYADEQSEFLRVVYEAEEAVKAKL
jgi:hypothetical protein